MNEPQQVACIAMLAVTVAVLVAPAAARWLGGKLADLGGGGSR